MEFTYKSYLALVKMIEKNGYNQVNYNNYNSVDRPVIYRHDIDWSIEKALRMAEIENDNDIKSTYFVLVSSDFYNILSKNNSEKIKRIQDMGHTIGLHFDEVRYPDPGDIEQLILNIEHEVKILSNIVGSKVEVVSMHRPSKQFLVSDIEIPGIINSYSSTFFRDFKYLSDSRRRYREPVEDIIKSREFKGLHILTHPIWYNDIEKNLYDSIKYFIDGASAERYGQINDNFTDLSSVIKIEAIQRKS